MLGHRSAKYVTVFAKRSLNLTIWHMNTIRQSMVCSVFTFLPIYLLLLANKKLHAHTQSAISCQEPVIISLVSKYNALCEKLKYHITHGIAPQSALPPLKIPKKRLWSLDVDDEIWQDVGLEDYEHMNSIPNWLGNEKVHQEIQAMLELNCCEEEEERLRRERSAMQCWMEKELDAVLKALEDTGEFFLDIKQCKYNQHFIREWYHATPTRIA